MAGPIDDQAISPAKNLAQPKFGKNRPSQILAAGPVLGFSPTLMIKTNKPNKKDQKKERKGWIKGENHF
jgi:hypothetical protein